MKPSMMTNEQAARVALLCGRPFIAQTYATLATVRVFELNADEVYAAVFQRSVASKRLHGNNQPALYEEQNRLWECALELVGV